MDYVAQTGISGEGGGGLRGGPACMCHTNFEAYVLFAIDHS